MAQTESYNYTGSSYTCPFDGTYFVSLNARRYAHAPDRRQNSPYFQRCSSDAYYTNVRTSKYVDVAPKYRTCFTLHHIIYPGEAITYPVQSVKVLFSCTTMI